MNKARSISGLRLGQQQGFTLLEVLLAFVVFALSFTVVLEILSGSMRNTVRAREYTEVSLIAQSVMDQLGLDIPLEEGTTQYGESGIYEWNVSVGSYDDSVEGSNSVQLAELTGIELLEIELVVSWGESTRQKSNTFSTVRAMLSNRVLLNK